MGEWKRERDWRGRGTGRPRTGWKGREGRGGERERDRGREIEG